ncbi:RNA pyrophosphohydrolase [Falsirhodobacter sp. 20TX0035]|uniref:RNA pyrophosphohydrolase n=1 Tax=Falsirhodobacter sp. 20TX0035 TaxID=3022019 RepID=UPI00232B9C0D|nr:RNA pyrophosphohydrolase [Falsirhodobacter sp. 20TX0035]MDB6452640.1 RNA pyrophosphohydrolase [Falsirhodobacter sp. 20TX0035]
MTDLPYRPCVGVMLINDRGEIFAGRRIDSDVPAWQMPQGGIDPGEEPEPAALRELWEETGVTADLVEMIDRTEDWVTYDLPPELLGKVWKGKYRGQKQKWFLFRFTGTDDQVNIASEHPEFSEWRWIEADPMIEAIVPFKRQVYEQVVAAFRPHLAPRGPQDTSTGGAGSVRT